jgi:hypothetical protein
VLDDQAVVALVDDGPDLVVVARDDVVAQQMNLPGCLDLRLPARKRMETGESHRRRNRFKWLLGWPPE